MPRVVQQAGDDPDPTPYLFVSLEQKRIDQTKPYDAKKACWVADEKDGYVLGEIKSTKGDSVIVNLPGGEEKTLKKEQLQQVNPPKYEKAEDMSNLTYLNDASVLHNLKQRYYHQLIYADPSGSSTTPARASESTDLYDEDWTFFFGLSNHNHPISSYHVSSSMLKF